MQYHEDCEELETYKNLNVRSLKNGVSPVLFMYYLIRSQDGNGKGYVDHTKFIKYLEKIKLNRNNFYTALNNSACHIFFTYIKEQNIIKYNSLEKVSQTLNVKPGKAISIPVPALTSLKVFNAFMYGSLFKKSDDRMITMSRERIKEYTGLSIQCQLNYEQAIDMNKHFNISCAIIPENIVGNPELTQQYIDSLPCSDKFYTKSGRRIVWQLPNSYSTRHMRVYKGKQHRANKSVKIVDEGSEAQANGRQAASSKLFYTDVTAQTMFTDEANSYIKTSYDVPTQYGNAHLYRFNNYAPTKNYENAVPNAHINQHGIVTIQKPSNKITDETI